MKLEYDIAEILRRLHVTVDNFETHLQWALDIGAYTTVRLTFTDEQTGRPTYKLVVGIEEPDDDDTPQDDEC